MSTLRKLLRGVLTRAKVGKVVEEVKKKHAF